MLLCSFACAVLPRSDIIEKHGCCVRVLGDLSLLPPDVREAMEGAVAASRHNTRLTLNICMSYSHQTEMTEASQIIQGALQAGIIIPDDVDAKLMQASLYTGISAALATERAASAATAALAASSPSAAAAAAASSSLVPPVPSSPNLLIRTSGETRLSDFLLWQCGVGAGETQLAFPDELWPDFSLWGLGSIVLEYSRVAHVLDARRKQRESEEQLLRLEADRRAVTRLILEERRIAARMKHEQQLQLEQQRRQEVEAALAATALATAAVSSSSSAFDGSDSDDDSDRSTPRPLSGSSSRSASASSSSSSGRSNSDDHPLLQLLRHNASVPTTSEDSESNSSGSDLSDRDCSHDGHDESPSVSPPMSASPKPMRTMNADSSSSADNASAYDPSAASSSSVLLQCGPASAPSTPQGLRSYWNTGGVVESVLHKRFAPRASGGVGSNSRSHGNTPDSRTGHSHSEERVDEAELQDRMAQYAAARQQRLHAYTLYARQHTAACV